MPKLRLKARRANLKTSLMANQGQIDNARKILGNDILAWKKQAMQVKQQAIKVMQDSMNPIINKLQPKVNINQKPAQQENVQKQQTANANNNVPVTNEETDTQIKGIDFYTEQAIASADKSVEGAIKITDESVASAVKSADEIVKEAEKRLDGLT